MLGQPAPVERDSRGILDPWLLRRRITLNRYPPGAALDGLVDRVWTVQWDLPEGVVHRQEVLTHPAANISVSHPEATAGGTEPEARVSGVATELISRTMAGRGWAVAAMTTPGGLGAFVQGSVAALTGRVLALGEVLELDESGLVRRAVRAPDDPARVDVLAAALGSALIPARIAAARRVAEVARLAETDRSLRTLADLATASGVPARTLQRLFDEYAGVSPSWVLRRYRLIEAAEVVREEDRPGWAQVAADLGYADQAHLVRDFRAATGRTPAAYAAGRAT